MRIEERVGDSDPSRSRVVATQVRCRAHTSGCFRYKGTLVENDLRRVCGDVTLCCNSVTRRVRNNLRVTYEDLAIGPHEVLRTLDIAA